MALPSSSTPSPPPIPLSPKSEALQPPAPAPASKPASPPKKTAPLPWSHPETLALIQAYQEKWYSAKRGPLKSSQWEEIAVAVSARCGFDEPSRTSTQCRHKMEKLRKRYRSDLQKPYPNLWQYFDLMYQLERGPMPLTARPVAIVKSSSSPANNSYNNDAKRGYGTNFYSASADYSNNINYPGGGDGGDSSESDEDWNSKGYGVGTAWTKKSKSTGGFRAAKTVNGKRKKYYEDSDEYEDGEDEEKTGVGEEREEGGGERELAAEIRGFAEKFMRMESKKIEMMRETERYWMEMEKKRTDMILENHRKIITSIGSAFGAHKKGKTTQES